MIGLYSWDQGTIQNNSKDSMKIYLNNIRQKTFYQQMLSRLRYAEVNVLNLPWIYGLNKVLLNKKIYI